MKKKPVTQSRRIAVTDSKQMKNENKKCLFCSLFSRCLSSLNLFEDSKSLIENCSIVDIYETPIRTRLKVNTYALTQLEVLATKEVSYGLYTYTKFVGDAVHATIGQ